MLKTSLMIVLAGFVFIFYTLPFSGIDLLIDAVGFLLLWNGLRGLKKSGLLVGWAIPTSFFLVGIATVQLFVGNIFIPIFSGLRFVGESIVFLSLLKALVPVAKNKTYKAVLYVSFISGIVYSLFSFLSSLPFNWEGISLFYSFLTFLVPALLLVSLLLFSNSMSET